MLCAPGTCTLAIKRVSGTGAHIPNQGMRHACAFSLRCVQRPSCSPDLRLTGRHLEVARILDKGMCSVPVRLSNRVREFLWPTLEPDKHAPRRGPHPQHGHALCLHTFSALHANAF